jgi:hyaluronoglucosaminidase
VAARLGLVEGYYGEPWSEAAREHVIAVLASRGYGFFIHAPKADEFLRRRTGNRGMA